MQEAVPVGQGSMIAVLGLKINEINVIVFLEICDEQFKNLQSKHFA